MEIKAFVRFQWDLKLILVDFSDFGYTAEYFMLTKADRPILETKDKRNKEGKKEEVLDFPDVCSSGEALKG